jgi:hypothetical protein
MTLPTLVILYLAFRAKQLSCDFFLQTSWMARFKGASVSDGGLKALGVHAGIHGIATFILMLIFAPSLWWLGAVDFVVHAGVDRVKTTIVGKYGWTYTDAPYWWAFGIDQEVHNLTHLAYIIAVIVHAGGVI